MFARRLISRKACRAARSENASHPLVLVYRKRCVRLYVIFIALEIMESEVTFYDDNFCKFHVLYACTGDACALETRRRFVTERGRKKKKKKKKESRNFNPSLTAWVINGNKNAPQNFVYAYYIFGGWYKYSGSYTKMAKLMKAYYLMIQFLIATINIFTCIIMYYSELTHLHHKL